MRRGRAGRRATIENGGPERSRRGAGDLARAEPGSLDFRGTLLRGAGFFSCDFTIYIYTPEKILGPPRFQRDPCAVWLCDWSAEDHAGVDHRDEAEPHDQYVGDAGWIVVGVEAHSPWLFVPPHHTGPNGGLYGPFGAGGVYGC